MRITCTARLARHGLLGLLSVALALSFTGLVTSRQFYDAFLSGFPVIENLGLRFEGGLRILYPDDENTIPAWFSSSMLLMCAVLLASISLTVREFGGLRFFRWLGLAVIFLFLSLDETVALHELLTEYSRALFGASGLLYYAWVIPVGVLVIVFALVYFGFLFELPARFRFLFALSGFIYVSGAIGLEMVGGFVFEREGEGNVTYVILATFEEFLEMSGVALFLHALMLYTARHPKSDRLTAP